MNDLGAQLIRRIKTTGPITLADYMAECLLHPSMGYYTTRPPFGRGGDFITAPEISQMFGELIGLALAQTWLDQGAPSRFVLAELGPGRGTLMQDALRATASVPGFHDAAQLVLVEASPALRTEQATRLPKAQFVDHLADIPEGPLFLVANEFFDALPVRQAIRDEHGWRERVIGAGETLHFGLTDPAPLAVLDHRLDDTKPGDIVEWHPALPAFAQEIGRRLNQHGGAALLIDYGHWHGTGDTFQAVQDHHPTDPLAAPGHADLTAHVDFAEIARHADTQHSGMTDQGVFLERLGITARAQSLAQNLRGSDLENHISAHRRLTHPDHMGTLFKVLGLVGPGAALPPGLDPPQ